MIGLSHSPLTRHGLAGWTQEQLATLAGWLESDPHRWPAWRVAVALRAIHAGDQRWRDRAAEVRR